MFCDIQIVFLTNSVVVSSVGKKRVDCTLNILTPKILSALVLTRIPLKSTSHLHFAKSLKHKIQVTRSQCVLEKYVEDNYYARLDTHSYHRVRETHFNSRLDVKS